MEEEKEKTTKVQEPTDRISTVSLPDFMFHKHVWAGEHVKMYINHGKIPDDQINPNGVDLTVDKVFITGGNTMLTKEKQNTIKPSLLELDPRGNISGFTGRMGWFLGPGYYVIQWAELIEIPHNAIGLLSPRSTLLRTCATVYGAVWDRGYYGYGQSGLNLFDYALLERGTALAQMCFIEAMQGEKSYNGQYQGEHVASKKERNTQKD